MKFGLRQGLVDNIIEAIASVEEVDQAIIYGSRAKGDYREGSDIDIVIKGENLSQKELNQVGLALDDLELPYLFDLAIYHHINNDDLKQHIKRVGKTLYLKPESC